MGAPGPERRPPPYLTTYGLIRSDRIAARRSGASCHGLAAPSAGGGRTRSATGRTRSWTMSDYVTSQVVMLGQLGYSLGLFLFVPICDRFDRRRLIVLRPVPVRVF